MEPRPPGRGTLAAVAAGLVLGAWAPIEGLLTWWEVAGAPAAALLGPPQPWFDLPALLLVVGLSAWATAGLVRRVPEAPAYRLVVMAAVVVVFAKLLVLPDVELPIYAPEPAALVVEAGRRVAGAAVDAAEAAEGVLPEDPALLTASLAELGRPLYLHHGVAVESYLLRVLHGCDGPHGEPGDDPPGTIYYCLSPDRRRGWVSVVALPGRRGAPDVVRLPEGRTFVVDIVPGPAREPGYDEGQEGGGRDEETP